MNFKSLSRLALEKLADEVSKKEDENTNPKTKEKYESLHQKRLNLVLEKLEQSGAKSVLDLGCGEGKLLKLLLRKKQFTKITGMDVSFQELQKAKQNWHVDEMSPKQRERFTLFQSSLSYRDDRFSDYDAVAIVEVIEHLDLNRLKSFERVVFEFAKPKTVVLSTPNQEYNVLFEQMEADTMRHHDHRFEWTRIEFQTWVLQITEKFGYQFEIFSVGEEMENVGAPSQMVVFKLKS